jgi:hypothetical protein
MVCSGIYSYPWNAISLLVIDIALLVSPLATSGRYFLFVMSVFFRCFSFVGLFKFYGVSLVMVWCVSCAGGVFRAPASIVNRVNPMENMCT